MRKILALVLGLLVMLGLAVPAVAAEIPAVQGVVTDEQGSPLDGAEVEVYRLDQGLVSVLRTDASGRFRLEKPVAPGELWQLRAWARGYRTAETGWVELAGQRYRTFKLTALAGGVTVLAVDQNGEPVTGYEISLLGPGGAYSGQKVAGASFRRQDLATGEYKVIVAAPDYLTASRSVTVVAGRTAAATVVLEKAGFAATGEVRSALTGAPIEGATVKLLREDQTLVRTGESNADGRFRMTLAEGAGGSYKLLVTAPGYRSVTTAVVTVTGGNELDWSGAEAVALQPLTGTILGSLQQSNGDTLINTPVVLELKGYGQVAETVSNETGEFRFEQVPAGSDLLYRVAIKKENQVAASPWAPVQAGLNNQILLKARGGSRIANESGSVAGLVVDPAGAPVEGAWVELLGRGAVIYTTQTRADGTFLFGSVQSPISTEPYTVQVRKPGYVTTFEFTVSGAEATELKVSPRVRSVIQAVLRPELAELTGRVLDARGRGIAAATVLVQAEGGRFEKRVTTDANGWYKVVTAPTGPAYRYTVSAEAPGFLPVAGVDVGTVSMSNKALPTLKLTATQTTVLGRVQSPDGTPRAGMTLRLHGQGREYGQAVTDENGSYRFTATLPRGAGTVLLLEARSEGCCGPVAVEVAGADLKAAVGATLSRDLTVRPQARLTGQVVDASGKPRAGVMVDLVAEGYGIYASVRSDEQGTYTFEGIDSSLAGPFWLRAGLGETWIVSLPGQPGVVPLVRLAPGRTTVQDLLVK